MNPVMNLGFWYKRCQYNIRDQYNKMGQNMGKSRSHVLKLSTKVLTVFNISAQTQWNSPISKVIIDPEVNKPTLNSINVFI